MISCARTGEKTIDPEARPEKQEANLNEAVTKLLKNYPPPIEK